MTGVEIREWLKSNFEFVLTFLVGAVIGPIIAWLAGKRHQAAKTTGEENKAAAAISTASRTIASAADGIVELYQEQINIVKQENAILKTTVARLDVQMTDVLAAIKNLREAFDYLCGEVEPDYPNAVRIARVKAGLAKLEHKSKRSAKDG